MRIAVLDTDRCKPKKCAHECYKFCPGVRSGNETITFEKDNPNSQPTIHENLCMGSGICAKRCPFHAIQIVNTPEQLDDSQLTHRYSVNSFVLFRLPIVKEGRVTGLVGQNGVGKTTALQILSGEMPPNLGRYENPPSWTEVIQFFRGTELQNLFEKLSSGDIKTVRKPQHVDRLTKDQKDLVVGDLLDKVDERGVSEQIQTELSFEAILDRKLGQLSGGELQKVTIGLASARAADIYLFDEPSSFLDISERLKVSRFIRRLSEEGKTVIVVEHDLAVLDYLSDLVCVFYGQPGAFGIVSNPHGVREGLNIYLRGYIPDENLQFRKREMIFKKSTTPLEAITSEQPILEYNSMEVMLGDFHLAVRPGKIHRGETIGILGPNGIGKTTFVQLLAGLIKPSKGEPPVLKEELKISYKPQYIAFSDPSMAVMDYLLTSDRGIVMSSWFKSEVLRPFDIERLADQELESLSGGEAQKVAISYCLAKEADLYLLDEPSAYLSVEDRLSAAKIIRRRIKNEERAAFIVEHDALLLDDVSDTLMVFLGAPGLIAKAYAPTDLRRGMNRLLGSLGVTFRRDQETGRPRVNKTGSKKDREQKLQGEYYYA
ncbi:MAG: ribosome biogenesis/translation initiation ATPase RLI [Promethearchaeota archaeon]